jgi:uncharacterized protein YjbI with pentapeptide repeats
MLSQTSRVFLDSICLLAGENWDDALSQAQRLSLITVVLISRNTGDAYYQREEIATAIEMSRAEASPHRVVPVLLEDVRNADVPYGLRRKHSIALDSRGLQAVAAALTDVLARSNGMAQSLPTSSDSAEMRRVYDICRRLSYEKLRKSRLALQDLHGIAKQAALPVRESIIAELKEFLLDLDELRWHIIPFQVRSLRKSVMDVIRTAARGELFRYFARGELEGIDLYGMDFASEDLNHMSFANCFLVEGNFDDANLVAASFSAARIRNANFRSAKLSGVDFTEADWFNASGLSESSLEQARRETLTRCPADLDGMYSELKRWYALQFFEWSTQVQRQLLVTWREYLKPGGLREVVENWRVKSW